MRKEEFLKICAKYPVVEAGGEYCWTPERCRQFTGLKSVNTIYNWIRKTKNGEMDLPILSPNFKKHRVLIPVRPFLSWFGYEGQN